jgi:hypothetical protein
MEQKERTFADGFIFKRREDAPDFVVGAISVKVDEAIAFLRNNEKNGWVNLDIKYGRTGNAYVELNTYESKKNVDKSATPKQEKVKPSQVIEEEDDEDLPF